MADSAIPDFEFHTGSSDLEPGDLLLRAFGGQEAISELYEYEIVLETHLEGGLAPELIESLMQEPCMIRFGEAAENEIHGMLCEVQTESMGTSFSSVAYRALLVPRLWSTTLTRRSRVYQEMNVVDIVKTVLEETGLQEDQHFELRLDGDYPEREYVVQYQETDFAFISRLMEHWGIFYFFVQNPDGELLVLTDTNKKTEPLEPDEPLRYDAAAALHGNTIRSMSRRHRMRPSKVVLRDYNWRVPDSVKSEADVDTVTGRGVHDFYGDHFPDTSQGDLLAKVRSEEMMAERETYHGNCNVPSLAAGNHFTLEGHPAGELDMDYLVTSVQKAGSTGHSGGGGFTQTYDAIPKAVPFRPRRVTPKPRIEGFIHAKIDGEAHSTAAPIDEHGRYKVVMPYDTAGQKGGKASRWIRKAQASAGPGYGMHLPLHIGAEVAIIHLGGDPDRPVIVGSVPNAETRSPVTVDNPTQSAIRSQSGIVIELDDDC